ncbi:citrate lyase subunit alpha [Anaerotalea alkaliphila]|uniref:Citrate lyase alpha chain n=1 Tax=Anaerotalea alkaliphila TaxID=2662126 RepID=A0A7X5HUD5_9FIRM|nr:citrate lyase subunit alpha [Anaerotalea alkaliphila]NDL66837.1 citrate lyase subunit alpha [Anaerotalea alkaliphila]
MLNAVDREIPEYLEGYGKMKLFDKFKEGSVKDLDRFQDRLVYPNRKKIISSIKRAVEAVGLKDGMTISFHHHFRSGDLTINLVLNELASMGFKDLIVSASSLTDVHAALIPLVREGVIRKFETSGLRGGLAEFISNGMMEIPIQIRSHGGRARAIVNGDLHIDVAFLGVSSCDVYGNANGFTGQNACGSLGYAKVDAEYADHVVMITDNLVECPNIPFSIPQNQVDHVVVVDKVGDTAGIMSGATRFTKNPRDLLIARHAADVVEASGYFYDGFSLQTGSGGASLATTRFLSEKMARRDIKASFALGGITGQIVKMHEEGLIGKLLDVQSFDLTAVQSLRKNPNHYEISAAYYANPDDEGSAVNQLDVVILSALEIDVDFNVNVMTGSDGVIRGASGGHCDTAAGACVTIIVAPLLRGRIPTVCDRVHTIITPGKTVDVLVTDQGIAVNPLRPELQERLMKSGLPVCSIEDLKERAYKLTGVPREIRVEDRIVGVVNYRDGSVIDVIRQVAK